MPNKIRPVHPGEILKDELQELHYSASQLAVQLRVPVNRITHILNKQRSITADTALRLAKFFGTTPEFWLNLQNAYDLKITQQRIGRKIDREVESRKAA
jgi:addiction module HigA family antidote